MSTLSAAELLSVWERGQGQSAVTQALLLLAAAAPDATPAALAQLSIGRRDARLLALREQLFGSHLTGLAVCPHCAQQLELSFAAAEIRAPAEAEPPAMLSVKSGGYEAQFRLPNSADLAALAEQPEAARAVPAAGAALLARCLLRVRRKGRNQTPLSLETIRALPPALLAAIAERMEQADRQANVQLALQCAACGQHWLAAFDIVTYLWRELEHWARGLLREVHWLASAYGWRESDILQMTARRRRAYLELLGRA